jgi:hypothetical protein
VKCLEMAQQEKQKVEDGFSRQDTMGPWSPAPRGRTKSLGGCEGEPRNRTRGRKAPENKDAVDRKYQPVIQDSWCALLRITVTQDASSLIDGPPGDRAIRRDTSDIHRLGSTAKGGLS